LYFFLDLYSLLPLFATYARASRPIPSHTTQAHTSVRGPEYLRANITARTRPQLFYQYAVSDRWCRRSISNRQRPPNATVAKRDNCIRARVRGQAWGGQTAIQLQTLVVIYQVALAALRVSCTPFARNIGGSFGRRSAAFVRACVLACLMTLC